MPGLVAGVGDEQTLELLYGLREFEGLQLDQFPFWIFFDPYWGDDHANDGSYLSPYRSIAKMKQVCGSYTRCSVKGQDRVFSPLTLHMTGIAAGKAYLKGETVTWDAGASSGTVLDWYVPLAILVIDQDAGAPPVDGELALVGQSSGAVADIRSGRGIVNSVGGHVVARFPDSAIDLATGVIALPGHSYADGEGPMRLFSSGALPPELSPGTDYTICAATGTGFQLDDDASCASPFASYANDGSGTHGIAGALNARADDPIAPDCVQRDRICVLIESLDPDHPARIDGNRHHPTGYDNRSVSGLFGPDPSDAIANVAGEGKGWLGWQNLHIQNVAIDPFANESGAQGKLVVLNSTARDTRNGSENRTASTATNNCFTTHGGGALIAINGGPSESRVDDWTQSGVGACLAPTGTSKFIAIGTGSFRSERVGEFRSATLAATGNDIVVIGHELLGASTGNTIAAILSQDAETRLQIAKAVLRSAPDGQSALAMLGGARRGTVRIHESTMHGNSSQWGEAIWLGSIGQSGLDFVAKGLLIDDHPLWLETQNLGGAFRNTNPFVLEGYFDDEDAAGGDAAEFLFFGGAGSLYPTSVASAQAAAVGRGAVNWELYRSHSANSGGSGDGTAWLSDTAELRCQPSEACWAAYRNWYDVDLETIYGDDPDLSCIPADVLGERICSFHFRGTHIGARGMPDSDRDLLADTSEPGLGTDPLDPDTDGDGLQDGFEVMNGFDPLVPGESGEDPDGDGLDNLAEQTHGTNPHASDSDGDFISDRVEVHAGSDPLDPRSVPITALPGPGGAGLALLAALLAAAGARALRAGTRAA